MWGTIPWGWVPEPSVYVEYTYIYIYDMQFRVVAFSSPRPKSLPEGAVVVTVSLEHNFCVVKSG